MIAKGEFEVDLQPLESYAKGIDGVTFGRFALEKTFRGDLEARSSGEMLSANTAVSGSAGYVAIEQVNGALHGRSGSFVLQHFGIMHDGRNRLILQVVPGSGSGQLAGLTGTMAITAADGRHTYELTYEVEE